MEQRTRHRVIVGGAQAASGGKEIVTLQYNFKPQSLDSSSSSTNNLNGDVKAKIASRGDTGDTNDITLLLNSETFRGIIAAQGQGGAGFVDCLLEIDNSNRSRTLGSSSGESAAADSGEVPVARLFRVSQVVTNLKQDQSGKRKRAPSEPAKSATRLVLQRKANK